MSINQRFTKLLEIKNIKQKTIAEKLGVTPQMISYIIKEKSKISIEYIPELIKIFPDLNLVWLLTGEGEPLVDNTINEAIEKYGHQNCIPKDIHQQCLDQLNEKDEQIKSLLKIIENSNE